MENIWGMWFFSYIPAFLCGCAVGGAAMMALAKKIIASQAKQIVRSKMPVCSPSAFLSYDMEMNRATLRKAC